MLIGLALLATLAFVYPAQAAEPIAFVDSAVINEWPNQIVFNVQARGEHEIRRVRLGWAVRNGVWAQQTMEFTPGREVSATLAIKTGRNDYVPPGSLFTYWFVVDDIAGNSVRTEEKQFRYLDTRFDWQSTSDGLATVYFHGQGSRFAWSVLEAAQRVARSVGPQTGGAITRPYTIVMYNSTAELDDARYLRNEQFRGFAAGTANIPFDVILLGPGTAQALGTVVGHEVAHLSIHQAGANPYLTLPAWLDEGLAEGFEPGGATYNRERMQRAVREGKVVPLADLARFPNDRERADLVYIQGWSFTRFLIARHGIGSISALLASYRNGINADGPNTPWLNVYGKSLAEMENDWRAEYALEALATPGPASVIALPTAAPVPTFPPLAVPTFPREGAATEWRADLPDVVLPLAGLVAAVAFTLSLGFAVAALFLRRRG